jgi:hypothetical protein
MWKALRRKFLAHSGKWTTIPWTVLSVYTQTEPVFCRCGTTATASHAGVCHDSRGVLDSHERKSLHCSDNSNGVNAEHCWCGELLHNGVATDFCISVTCSYSCRPILQLVPFSIRASSFLSLP